MDKLKFLLSVIIIITAGYIYKTQVKAVVTTIETADGITVEQNTAPESAGGDNLYDTQVFGEVDPSTGQLSKIDKTTTGWFPATLKSMVEMFLPKAQIILDKDTGEPLTTADGKIFIYQEPSSLDSVLAFNRHFYQNPPASGIVYAQEQYYNITQGYKAKAVTTDESWVYYPGLGFNLLNPIKDYWILSRNIAYLAMIIIIVIVAFLVMFKANLGGQMQVTIANSIPNIVIALLMITISYPLSGFAIDLITIGSNTLQQILVQNKFSPGYEEVWNKDTLKIFYTGEMDGLLEYLNISKRLNYELDNPRNHIQPDDLRMSIWEAWGAARIQIIDLKAVGQEDVPPLSTIVPDAGFLGGTMKNIVGSISDSGLGDILGLIVSFIFIVTAMTISLKLFFKLLIKYLILVVYPIVSPFIMLSIAIPGVGGKTIIKYFKTLVSASLAFVSIYGIFLFMVVLTHDTKIDNNLTFAPPLLGYDLNSSSASQATLPIGGFLKMILAFGLFLSTPAIPEALDQYFNVIPEWFSSGRQPLAQRVAGNIRSHSIAGVGQSGGLISAGITRLPGVGKPVGQGIQNFTKHAQETIRNA